jgi:hypothetical protein
LAGRAALAGRARLRLVSSIGLLRALGEARSPRGVAKSRRVSKVSVIDELYRFTKARCGVHQVAFTKSAHEPSIVTNTAEGAWD